MYNTGSQTRGFRNGYVAKVVGNAGIADAIPAATPSGDLRELAAAENNASEAPAAPLRPAPPPKWNVFERAAYERETLLLVADERGRT
jgi:type IV secretion system protein VirB1